MKERKVNFDRFLTEEIKPFGRYQKLVLVCLVTGWFVSPFNLMGVSFTSATPKHHCSLPLTPGVGDGNFTRDELMAFFIPRTEDGSYSGCKIYKRNLSDLITGRYSSENGSVVTSEVEDCDTFTYDQSQYISTLVTQLNLVCGQKYKETVFKTSYIVGMMVSCIVFSFLIDYFGRRPILIVTFLANFTCIFIIAFVDNFYLYCVMRFLVAFFAKGATNVAYVLGQEIVGPSCRALVGTIFMLAWAAGYMVLALVAYLLRDHKHLQIAIGAISSCMVLLCWFIPESPRWLITKGRHKQARDVCEKMARWNRVQLTENYGLIVEKENTVKGRPIDLVKTKSMRRNVLILAFGWMTVSFVYFCISWNTADLGGNDYINFFLSAAVEVPAYFLNLFALNKIGRRFSTAFSMFLSGVLLFSLIPIPQELFVLRVTFGMVIKFLVTAAFSMIFQYTTELLPTTLRGLGFGWCTGVSRIGGVIASNIVLLGEIHKDLPSILLAVFPLASGLLFLVTPETKGKPLPQTVEEVEEAAKRSRSPLIRLFKQRKIQV